MVYSLHELHGNATNITNWLASIWPKRIQDMNIISLKMGRNMIDTIPFSDKLQLFSESLFLFHFARSVSIFLFPSYSFPLRNILLTCCRTVSCWAVLTSSIRRAARHIEWQEIVFSQRNDWFDSLLVSFTDCLSKLNSAHVFCCQFVLFSHSKSLRRKPQSYQLRSSSLSSVRTAQIVCQTYSRRKCRRIFSSV